MFKIKIITLIIALLIWFGIAALLTYLASLSIGFSMSLVKVEIAHAREDVRKMRDKLSDAEIGIEALSRELVAVKAANERLRKELGYE